MSHVQQSPDRQPRRHRLPHHPHAATHGHRERSRCIPRPIATRGMCAQADEAVCIGPAPAAQSYLDVDAHPRSRARQPARRPSTPATASCPKTPTSPKPAQRPASPSSARRRADARLRPEAHGARAGAQQPACRCCPAPACSPTLDHARAEAARIGYPVMLKSTAGGGGIGMQLDRAAEAELAPSLRVASSAWPATTSRTPACSSRSTSQRARHIEVQIFGDGDGNVVALGERDCSVQRRNQKVIEETPAPGLARRSAQALLDTAVRARQGGRATARAGTVEFVYDTRHERVLFPRGEHAPAGRARRHRGGHRRRPGRMDGAPGGRRTARRCDQSQIAPRGASIQVAPVCRRPRPRLPARAPAC